MVEILVVPSSMNKIIFVSLIGSKTSHCFSIGYVVKCNEIGRVCSTYGVEERCMQGFGGET